MTGPATPQGGRSSSQELADRVREKLLRSMSVTDAHLYTHADFDDALAALDVLAARLQATEQALREFHEDCGCTSPGNPSKCIFSEEPYGSALRALEGAAE